ncbi:hypothetical protein NEPAR04_1770 [Nematocida parisii]|nr:hypothetical protein NEPAR08_1860 [Nematocida parisii]KAI5131190.1 hypothetical protein NEPAR03_2325 [Nematocida parisii]KAI5143105.1 hypothetical protein NEPAR04_1770 [Nematocida parisii]
MNTTREEIERMLSEDNTVGVKEVLNKPDTPAVIRDMYTVLLDTTKTELDILSVLNIHNNTPISYLIYGDYLLRNNKVNESIDKYTTAVKLSTDPSDTESILKVIIFAYLQIKDLPNAFYTGWSLIEMSNTGYNLRLLYFISQAIITQKGFLNHPILQESLKTKKLIGDNLILPKDNEVEILKSNDIEIISAPGTRTFLNKHNINISRDVEVGIITDTLPYFNLIHEHGFNTFIKEYHNTIPNEYKTQSGLEVDVLSYLIKSEDILMLYKVSNYFYTECNYFCSLVLFRCVIELFSRIDTYRSKFMQLSSVIGSNAFTDIFMISPVDYDKYIQSVKKLNLSIFIVSKGNSKDHPLDKVLSEHFSDKVSLIPYTIPDVYKYD